MTVRIICADHVRAALDYDLATGIFRWRGGRGRCGPVAPGSIAGRIASNGYVEITIQKRHYGAHRLAWLYVHGRWPEGTIDHRDGVKTNNWIDNLREATEAQNRANIERHGRNTSGHKGVHYSQRDKRWIAKISVSGKLIQLGRFKDKASAISAYRDGALRYHGAFSSLARNPEVRP